MERPVGIKQVRQPLARQQLAPGMELPRRARRTLHGALLQLPHLVQALLHMAAVALRCVFQPGGLHFGIHGLSPLLCLWMAMMSEACAQFQQQVQGCKDKKLLWIPPEIIGDVH